MLAAESPTVHSQAELQRGAAGGRYSPSGSTLAWSIPPKQHAARSAHLAPSAVMSAARSGSLLH